MEQTCQEYLDETLKGKEYVRRIDSIRRFERQLTDNGYLVLKFFMHISRKEQSRRDGASSAGQGHKLESLGI